MMMMMDIFHHGYRVISQRNEVLTIFIHESYPKYVCISALWEDGFLIVTPSRTYVVLRTVGHIHHIPMISPCPS